MIGGILEVHFIAPSPFFFVVDFKCEALPNKFEDVKSFKYYMFRGAS